MMEFKRKRGRPRKDEMRSAPYPSVVPTGQKMGRVKKETVVAKKNFTGITEQQAGDEHLHFHYKEKDAGEAEADSEKPKKGTTKFDYLFIYGLVSSFLRRGYNANEMQNSIAVDSSELKRLIMKTIRKQKINEKDSSAYRSFIATEQRAVDGMFYSIKWHHNFDKGETILNRRMLKRYKMTPVVCLALEALEQVPKTWKNAHAIFATAVKVLEDMWKAIE